MDQKKRYITKEIFHKEGSSLRRGGGGGGDCAMALLVSQTRWEFISSDEEFSPLDREANQPCVLSSYSIIPNP